ncbi:hypothetical protein D3C85_1642390 [compost metagenome]
MIYCHRLLPKDLGLISLSHRVEINHSFLQLEITLTLNDSQLIDSLRQVINRNQSSTINCFLLISVFLLLAQQGYCGLITIKRCRIPTSIAFKLPRHSWPIDLRGISWDLIL